MKRAAITFLMSCGLVLATWPAGAVAAPPRAFDAFVSLPEVEDEVLLAVVVGPAVRAKRAITVDGAVDRAAYRAAWSSARDRRNRRREANAIAVGVTQPSAFDPFGSVPLSYTVGEYDIIILSWMLHVPTADGVVDRSALARVRMPAVARRAVRSLIDTSTGEVVWADE